MAEGSNWITGAYGHKFIASFSGEKDSTLALYKAMKLGEAVGLIVMLEEEGYRSHGLSPAFLQAQAESIGLPLTGNRRSRYACPRLLA